MSSPSWDDNGGTADSTVQTSAYRPPSLLPVSRHKEPILYLVESTPVLILVGQTGSGKTTQIPQFLWDAGWCADGKQVAVTQPRRVAAVSVATRVAEEMNSPLGDTVGYSIRFEDKTSERTQIKFMTDGLLLREALVDPLFSRYSVIMVDEAHERSLSSDLLLGLLKKVMRKRPELRIVISSATIETNTFLDFFNDRSGDSEAERVADNARALSVEGRMFPVEIQYLTSPTEDYVSRAAETVLDIHQREEKGDVLVFLTGRDEIQQAMQLIQDQMHELGVPQSSLLVLPLYSGLPAPEQMRVFDAAPENTRKVIVATNIAEASLTIDGVVYVVDSGFVKLRSYNPQKGVESVAVVPVSRAAATQRAGRAGRTQPGKCFRLYSEDAYAALSRTTPPELERADLAPVILHLKALGIDNVARFPFVGAGPAPELFVRALELLRCIGALDEYAKLTRPAGLHMAELAGAGVGPMAAKAVLESVRFGCVDEMLAVASMASVVRGGAAGPLWWNESDRRELEMSRRKFAVDEGDHLTMLNVFNAFERTSSDARARGGEAAAKRWCGGNQLNYALLAQAVRVRNQLRAFLGRLGALAPRAGAAEPVRSAGLAEAVRKCLATGYFAHAARMRPDGTFELVAGTAKAVVYAHPSSLMFNRTAEWVVYGEIVSTGKGGKVYIKDVTKIERDWLLEFGGGYYRRL